MRELDPHWRPTPSLTETIEGEISAAEAEAREAEERLTELSRQEPNSLIDAYRRQQGFDLLGDPIWSREQNSVATCQVDSVPYIGVNSQALTYTGSDRTAAEQLRSILMEKYPDVMNTDDIGQFPNDAVFHAEATCLLRAARANGRILRGRVIEITVDRVMCPSCRTILPAIGLELGNPTVRFTDPRGMIRTMRDGAWPRTGCAMKKSGYFDSREIRGWPDPTGLKPFFFAQRGQEWFHTGGNDGASIEIEGINGTDNLPLNRGRIDIRLLMWGIPNLGVLLIYTKWGGGLKETYSSKGDLSRLREWVRNLHNTPLPVGLFIPFKSAWFAVKEFIETDGDSPKCIKWVPNKDLPPGTFPDP